MAKTRQSFDAQPVPNQVEGSGLKAKIQRTMRRVSLAKCLMNAEPETDLFSASSALYTQHQESYSGITMWNVDERFEKKTMDSLAALGFAVGSTRGVVRVEKYGSGAEFRQVPDGHFQMTIMPAIMLHGQFTRLWDAGYQKFLLTTDGAKFPALAEQLA